METGLHLQLPGLPLAYELSTTEPDFQATMTALLGVLANADSYLLWPEFISFLEAVTKLNGRNVRPSLAGWIETVENFLEPPPLPDALKNFQESIKAQQVTERVTLDCIEILFQVAESSPQSGILGLQLIRTLILELGLSWTPYASRLDKLATLAVEGRQTLPPLPGIPQEQNDGRKTLSELFHKIRGNWQLNSPFHDTSLGNESFHELTELRSRLARILDLANLTKNEDLTEKLLAFDRQLLPPPVKILIVGRPETMAHTIANFIFGCNICPPQETPVITEVFYSAKPSYKVIPSDQSIEWSPTSLKELRAFIRVMKQPCKVCVGLPLKVLEPTIRVIIAPGLDPLTRSSVEELLKDANIVLATLSQGTTKASEANLLEAIAKNCADASVHFCLYKNNKNSNSEHQSMESFIVYVHNTFRIHYGLGRSKVFILEEPTRQKIETPPDKLVQPQSALPDILTAAIKEMTGNKIPADLETRIKDIARESFSATRQAFEIRYPDHSIEQQIGKSATEFRKGFEQCSKHVLSRLEDVRRDLAISLQKLAEQFQTIEQFLCDSFSHQIENYALELGDNYQDEDAWNTFEKEILEKVDSESFSDISRLISRHVTEIREELPRVEAAMAIDRERFQKEFWSTWENFQDHCRKITVLAAFTHSKKLLPLLPVEDSDPNLSTKDFLDDYAKTMEGFMNSLADLGTISWNSKGRIKATVRAVTNFFAKPETIKINFIESKRSEITDHIRSYFSSRFDVYRHEIIRSWDEQCRLTTTAMSPVLINFLAGEKFTQLLQTSLQRLTADKERFFKDIESLLA